MKLMKTITLQAAVLAIAAMFAGNANAQALPGTATIHGHLNNPAGQPIKGATVQFTRQLNGELKDRKWDYKTTTDDNGDYKVEGVATAEYFADATQDGKNLDFVESVKVAAGENKTVDFDMSRKEFIDKMSPEDKAALEEYKKKIAGVTAGNKVVANLNATLSRVRADVAAAQPPVYGDVSKDVVDMKSTVDSKPDESVLWVEYANTMQAQADHLAHEDRVAKKSVMSDDDVIKLYNDAAVAYQKAIDLNVASKKPTPADQAIEYNQLGNTEGKLGKTSDASAAFENAVKLDPTKAGMYYNNEAAVLFNVQQSDGALAAAEKAIAADPTRPDPYFIKGQVLIAKSAYDAKTQKLIPPPGCVEAYQKYLTMVPPENKNAISAREVLQSLGEKIDMKYNSNQQKKK